MCGIIAAAGDVDVRPGIEALAPRGPDGAGCVTVGGVTLGHTRLAIQDPTPRSDQPFTHGHVTLVYNGELFNKAEIAALCGPVSWRTSGDTEVLAAALNTRGASVLSRADGMFALAWADDRDPGALHVARDRFGQVPLHVHLAEPVLAASELKAFTAMGRRCGAATGDVPPGVHWRIGPGQGEAEQFAGLPAGEPRQVTHEARARGLRALLGQACQRRLISDVPVCTLLSGGIDSAVIAFELESRYPGLVAYTAVMDRRSPDLRAARVCADALGIKLVEVPVAPPTRDDLAHVVRVIEQPGKAQAEIGWPCLILAQVIAADGFKVTYSGEGSDELWASYGFAYHAVQQYGWDGARRRMITGEARKNFPRVSKAFGSAGVEARLPWLDPDLVAFCLGCSQAAAKAGTSRPKGLLSQAYETLLPPQITSRAKLAFQDALGVKAMIAELLPDPGRFYRAEYTRAYG